MLRRLRVLFAAACLVSGTLLLTPGSAAANLFQTSNSCYPYRDYANMACLNENAFGTGDENLIQHGAGGQYNLLNYTVTAGDGICQGQGLSNPYDWNDCISRVFLNLDDGFIFCAYTDASLGGSVAMARYGPLWNASYNFNTTYNDTTTSFRVVSAQHC